MEIEDEYKQKQVNKYLTPLHGGSEVTYKAFKYSLNHTDSERRNVGVII